MREQVLAMFCSRKDYVIDPVMAEAIAAGEAVKLAQRMELRNIILRVIR
jgi:hypothetical protein